MFSTDHLVRNVLHAYQRVLMYQLLLQQKSQRRAESRNNDLERRVASPWATEDQYALFRNYLDSRHADGGMADMDVFEFAAMVEETPIQSRVIEYKEKISK